MFSSVGTSITSWAPRLRSNGKVVSSDSPHHISRARDHAPAGGVLSWNASWLVFSQAYRHCTDSFLFG